jgi:hypothetical protein
MGIGYIDYLLRKQPNRTGKAMTAEHKWVSEEECSCDCRGDDPCNKEGCPHENHTTDPDDLLFSERGISSLLLIEEKDKSESLSRQVTSLTSKNRRLRMLLSAVIKTVLEDPNVRTVMDGREMTSTIEAIRAYCEKQ